MNQTQKSKIVINISYTKRMEVPEDVCLNVQAAQLQFESMRDVIANIIEQHAMDTSDTIVHSPIFKSYLKMAANAKYDWESEKNKMLDVAFPNGRDLVTNWTLDYESHVLQYNELSEGTGRPVEIFTKEVDATTVDEIRAKHTMTDCIESVMQYLAAAHAQDVTDIITPSKVFAEFVFMLSEAKKDFEQAKQNMLNVIFGEEISSVSNWSLDYNSCILTYSK